MTNIKLELSLQEIQVIGSALQELPYKTVVNLLNKIDQQVIPQIAPKPEQEA